MFLTESGMGTAALPIVMESVKEKERDLEFLPQNIIISSVLSTLSTVIQVLTPSIHFRIERMRSRI